ncbi:hypothetical protein VPH35_018040 [Triticum aestivum]
MDSSLLPTSIAFCSFLLHFQEEEDRPRDQKVGSDGYGDVYRATHQGEEIAVKKLHQLHGLDDKQFHAEYRNLRQVRHKNVVWLIGYCDETRSKYMNHNGELVFSKIIERVLCFEYMQGGGLDKHITGN